MWTKSAPGAEQTARLQRENCLAVIKQCCDKPVQQPVELRFTARPAWRARNLVLKVVKRDIWNHRADFQVLTLLGAMVAAVFCDRLHYGPYCCAGS